MVDRDRVATRPRLFFGVTFIFIDLFMIFDLSEIELRGSRHYSQAEAPRPLRLFSAPYAYSSPLAEAASTHS